jgi:disulfide oxidoreductase YuzD
MKINIIIYDENNIIQNCIEIGSLKKAQLKFILLEAEQQRKYPNGKITVTLHHSSNSVGDYEEYVDITNCFHFIN